MTKKYKYGDVVMDEENIFLVYRGVDQSTASNLWYRFEYSPISHTMLETQKASGYLTPMEISYEVLYNISDVMVGAILTKPDPTMVGSKAYTYRTMYGGK